MLATFKLSLEAKVLGNRFFLKNNTYFLTYKASILNVFSTNEKKRIGPM